MTVEHHIICDAPDCDERLTGEDRQRLGILVRQEGWKVEASGFALCPDHVAERRAESEQTASSEYDQRGW